MPELVASNSTGSYAGNAHWADQLRTLEELVARFGLEALRPTLSACRDLAQRGAPIDVAVLGQFKSGKSSLLNAVLGAELLPVGVLPLTAVVTRVSGGHALIARVARLDGAAMEVPISALPEYATEMGNPGNVRGVAMVDIHTPALADLPGLRLVDTPGLGSVHAHNTQSTLDWLPRVALAIVAVSVERPLSAEDRRLIQSLRPLASRVVVVLTKTDLVSEVELEQVRSFVAAEIREALGLLPGAEPLIVPFSVRRDRDAHVAALRERVLAPISRNAEVERDAALGHKLTHLARATREYLQVALIAAERVGKDRDALRAAVVDETVRESIIAEELVLAAGSVSATARPSFEKALAEHAEPISRRIVASLGEMSTWRGHLAKQVAQYRSFTSARMTDELTALEPRATATSAALISEAEMRLRRIAIAFRDRLGRNVSRSLGVSLSPVAWEMPSMRIAAPSIAMSSTFMTHWDLLWWMLPMPLIGGIFRWHCRRKVPWDVWVNLQRYAGGWAETTARAIEATKEQALAWTRAERQTLQAVLSASDEDVAVIRQAIARLERGEIAPK